MFKYIMKNIFFVTEEDLYFTSRSSAFTIFSLLRSMLSVQRFFYESVSDTKDTTPITYMSS